MNEKTESALYRMLENGFESGRLKKNPMNKRKTFPLSRTSTRIAIMLASAGFAAVKTPEGWRLPNGEIEPSGPVAARKLLAFVKIVTGRVEVPRPDLVEHLLPHVRRPPGIDTARDLEAWIDGASPSDPARLAVLAQLELLYRLALAGELRSVPATEYEKRFSESAVRAEKERRSRK